MKCDVGVNFFHESTDEVFEAALLQNSPPVKSVGKRCREGWGMFWPPGSDAPFMIKPKSKLVPLKVIEASKVYLKVICDVPYFVEDNPSCLVAAEPAAEAPVDGDEIEEAEVKPSEEARLREEALSPEHLACHFPKNPFCTPCNRAKMFKHRSRKRVRGSFRDDAIQFDDNATADPLIPKRRNVSFEGSSSAVVTYDITTKWTEPFPTPSQDFHDVTQLY